MIDLEATSDFIMPKEAERLKLVIELILRECDRPRVGSLIYHA